MFRHRNCCRVACWCVSRLHWSLRELNALLRSSPARTCSRKLVPVLTSCATCSARSGAMVCSLRCQRCRCLFWGGGLVLRVCGVATCSGVAAFSVTAGGAVSGDCSCVHAQVANRRNRTSAGNANASVRRASRTLQCCINWAPRFPQKAEFNIAAHEFTEGPSFQDSRHAPICSQKIATVFSNLL
jgi:hypothetical protein